LVTSVYVDDLGCTLAYIFKVVTDVGGPFTVVGVADVVVNIVSHSVLNTTEGVSEVIIQRLLLGME
jgi:hypothetical protein